MMNRLCIGAALAVCCACALTGRGNKTTSAPKANDVEMPTAPMEAPKLQPAPDKAGAEVSKFDLPATVISSGTLEKLFPPQAGTGTPSGITNVKKVAWVVQGLPDGSDCTKAMQAILDGASTIDFWSDGASTIDFWSALLPQAQNSCSDVASKIETIWLQVDFVENFPIKSMKGEIDVDGAVLVNLIEGKEDRMFLERMFLDQIDGAHFDMQGLSKATMWVDVSQAFMKSLKVEMTVDEASVRKMTNPSELRDVAASSLSHAKLLTSDLLFSFAPGSVVPSSVVQRRLSPPIRSLAAHRTPEVVPSATEACKMPEGLINAGNAAQRNAGKANIISLSSIFGGLSPQSECCTALQGFNPSMQNPAGMSLEEAKAVMKEWGEVQKVCKPELQKVKALLHKQGGTGWGSKLMAMENALWQLFSQAPHAAAMIGMAAAAPLAKTEVASQFTGGAVSLVGSLALLAAVAGALTTRSRRQARSVQNVGSVESAEELTTHEVA